MSQRWMYCGHMDGVISTRNVVLAALAFAVVLGVAAVMDEFGLFEPSVDNPVGTLRFDELSSALATDPIREAERIVGHVWRFEGPKATPEEIPGITPYWVDLVASDGFHYVLEPYFATHRDRSRFDTEDVTIACLVTSTNFDLVTPESPSDGTRSIIAKSCRVIESDTNPQEPSGGGK
jgi:hypothetical protein